MAKCQPSKEGLNQTYPTRELFSVNTPNKEISWLGNDYNGNSSLYNGMIAPWVKMTIRGAIWYQGQP